MRAITLTGQSGVLPSLLSVTADGTTARLQLAIEAPPPTAGRLTNFKPWLTAPKGQRTIWLPSSSKTTPALTSGQAAADAFFEGLKKQLDARRPINGNTLLYLSEPAFDNDTRKVYRAAVTEALRKAGFLTKNVEFFEEPDAVYEYSRVYRRLFRENEDANILVIDFGAGTCNVSGIVTNRAGSLTQRAMAIPLTAEAPKAGGLYIDQQLLTMALKEAGLVSLYTTAGAEARKAYEEWCSRHSGLAERLKVEVSTTGQKRLLEVPLDGPLKTHTSKINEALSSVHLAVSQPLLEGIVRQHWEQRGIQKAVEGVLQLMHARMVKLGRKDVPTDPRALVTHVILAGGSSQLASFDALLRSHFQGFSPTITAMGAEYSAAVAAGIGFHVLDQLDRLDDRRGDAAPTPMLLRAVPEDLCLQVKTLDGSLTKAVPIVKSTLSAQELLEGKIPPVALSLPKRTAVLQPGETARYEFQLVAASDASPGNTLNSRRLNQAETGFTLGTKFLEEVWVHVSLQHTNRRSPLLKLSLRAGPRDSADLTAVVVPWQRPASGPLPAPRVTTEGEGTLQNRGADVLCIDFGTSSTVIVDLQKSGAIVLDALMQHAAVAPAPATPATPTIQPPRKAPTPVASVEPVMPAPPVIGKVPAAIKPPTPLSGPVTRVPKIEQEGHRELQPGSLTSTPVPMPLVAVTPRTPPLSIPPIEVLPPVTPPVERAVRTEVLPTPPSTQRPAADPVRPLVEASAPVKVPSPLQAPYSGTERGLVQGIVTRMRKAGLEISEELIESVYLSLKVRPFVVLAGPSGVGKSALARFILEAFGARFTSDGEGIRVAVEAHWTDSRFLLGRRDGGEYRGTDLLALLERSAAQKQRVHGVILDELNLAHVEYYFAPFLSAMEGDGEICLPDRVEPNVLRLPQSEKGVPLVHFFGTLNIDETTQILSDKVLDRANLIEVPAVAPPEQVPTRRGFARETAPSAYVPAAKLQEWAEIEADILVPLEIRQVWSALANPTSANPKEKGQPIAIGRRVITEMAMFVRFAEKLQGQVDRKTAIDLQVLQRILPKIHGDTRLKLTLEGLDRTLKEHGLERSRERLERLTQQLKHDQFTSFWS